jgi:hypothetical protein
MEFAAETALNHQPSATQQQGSSGYAPWEALVEPSRIFVHPRDVLAATDLTREEKRAVLASWASDVWVVESAPGLRHCPGLPGCWVSLDEVLAALKALDPQPPSEPRPGGAERLRPIRWPSQGLPGTAR